MDSFWVAVRVPVISRFTNGPGIQQHQVGFHVLFYGATIRQADHAGRQPRYFMHRDFQSKNIHFLDGKVRIIDFQTATCGLVQYDLASLLKDPYAPLEPDERQELLGFYLKELSETWNRPLDVEPFTTMFHRAGLQRTMQALGAFAFLSMRKGKKKFEAYIPSGIANLREALGKFSEYPALADLTAHAALVIGQGRLPKPAAR